MQMKIEWYRGLNIHEVWANLIEGFINVFFSFFFFFSLLMLELDRRGFFYFAGIYLRQCQGNKVLWIWVFFFSFYFGRNVSEFNYFRVFFKVLFSTILGWIFSIVQLGGISAVDFRLILLLFLVKLLAFTVWKTYRQFEKWVTKPFYWLMFPVYSLVPEFVLRVPVVVLDKKER